VLVRRVLVSTEHLARSPEWTRRNLQAVTIGQVSARQLVHQPPDALVIETEDGSGDRQSVLWGLREALDIPCVAIIGSHPGEPLAGAAYGGADVYLHSPADAQVAAAAAAALLRRARPISATGLPAVLHLDGVEVDLVQRTVRRGSTSVLLSRTEFSLLSFLVRADGRVCTQRELLLHVWGAEHASESHYLRLYVRYLRKKLEADPANPRYLVTVRGAGYRFITPTADGQPATLAEAAVSAASNLAEGRRTWNALYSSSAANRARPLALRASIG
jgi:two-component system KDP operon response regulator KdpE